MSNADSLTAWQMVRPFVLGGASTMMATCCIQPIDMVKVRLQLAESGAKRGPLTTAINLFKNEGPRVFYSGLSAALFRQLTYGTTRMGVYTTMEDHLKDENGNVSWSNKLLIGATAGGIGSLVGTPADAALIRMQADTLLPKDSPARRGYKHVVDALFRMAREEGFRGFFAGASPTLYRGLAVNLGQLTTYSSYKSFTEQFVSQPTAVHVLAGFMSGATAATASLPFDFIKTRLQRMTKNANGEYPYRGFADCLVKSVRQDGPLVLYRGYFTYVFRIAPHITLTWVFLEFLKKHIQ